MIRAAMPLVAIALVGCTPRHAKPVTAITSSPTACGTEFFSDYVGQTRFELEADIAAHAQNSPKAIRFISPGMAVTMDFRADRLNAYVDDKAVITRFSCG